MKKHTHKSPEHPASKGIPPYRVDIVDQFQGHDEYGYDPVTHFESLDEAIEAARKITVEGIKEFESVEKWRGFGTAGLVYDSKGKLVWDGISEYSGK